MSLSFATATTGKIKVSVESFYQNKASDALSHHYVFAYRITLENFSDTAVQLLSRHWHIVDTLSENKEVKGEGVVGEQPVIIPGEHYQYVSWCQLSSDIGKMQGTYTFLNLSNGEEFIVIIPAFCLQSSERLN